MNKKQSPAVIYYQILELREKITKQIEELNKSLKCLTGLNAKVGEGSVNVQSLINELMVKQIELDVLYKKLERDIKEDVQDEREWLLKIYLNYRYKNENE